MFDPEELMNNPELITGAPEETADLLSDLFDKFEISADDTERLMLMASLLAVNVTLDLPITGMGGAAQSIYAMMAGAYLLGREYECGREAPVFYYREEE